MTRARWASPALLALVVVGFGGCSSRPAPDADAVALTDAGHACVDLLSIGAQVSNQDTVTSKSAEQALSSAVASANEAASLDSARWKVFAGTVHTIQIELERDYRVGLDGTLDDFAVDCEPLVSVSGTTSTTG